MTKEALRRVVRPLLCGAALLGLAACVYAPPPGYAYAPQPGYYAAPGYYAPGYAYPPVVGSIDLGFGGYWGGGGHRWR